MSSSSLVFEKPFVMHLLSPFHSCYASAVPTFQCSFSQADICALIGAGHVRAAAATAIAFLACHPIGAKGDECMWGPYREALLEAGALRVLLEAALAPTEDDNCRKVIEKAAAVGVMYLCTVVSCCV